MSLILRPFYLEHNVLLGFQLVKDRYTFYNVHLFSFCDDGRNSSKTFYAWVSGEAVQPVPLASLKLSMAVYGQKLDGRPSG